MKQSPEIESVFRRMWKALVERDRDALVNLSTDHPDMRLVLPADDEWTKVDGRFAEIMIDRAEQIGIVGVEIDRLEAFEHGDAGWFAANVTALRSTGDPLPFRQTGVVVIEAGVWRALLRWRIVVAAREGRTVISFPCWQSSSCRSVRGLPVPARSDSAGGAVVLALRLVVSRRRGTARRTRCRG
jgi:hypothetical protein